MNQIQVEKRCGANSVGVSRLLSSTVLIILVLPALNRASVRIGWVLR